MTRIYISKFDVLIFVYHRRHNHDKHLYAYLITCTKQDTIWNYGLLILPIDNVPSELYFTQISIKFK